MTKFSFATQEQIEAFAEMERLLSGARRSANLAFPDKGVRLRSEFQVGIHQPADFASEIERAGKVHAARLAHPTVGRRLIDVDGYTFWVFVTNRHGDCAELWRDHTQRATGRADPARSADFCPEGEVGMEWDFFGNFLSCAGAIHAAGDKRADHGGSALPGIYDRARLFLVRLRFSCPYRTGTTIYPALFG